MGDDKLWISNTINKPIASALQLINSKLCCINKQLRKVRHLHQEDEKCPLW